jgi:Na+/proline symporter
MMLSILDCFFDATLFESSSSESRQWWLLLGFLAFVGLYSTLSGLWGVAITDAIQFVLAMTGWR